MHKPSCSLLVLTLSLVLAASTSAQTTVRITVGSHGEPGNGAPVEWGRWVDVTPDGRFVAFASEASDLVPGDTNGLSDILPSDDPAALQAMTDYLMRRAIVHELTHVVDQRDRASQGQRQSVDHLARPARVGNVVAKLLGPDLRHGQHVGSHGRFALVIEFRRPAGELQVTG